MKDEGKVVEVYGPSSRSSLRHRLGSSLLACMAVLMVALLVTAGCGSSGGDEVIVDEGLFGTIEGVVRDDATGMQLPGAEIRLESGMAVHTTLSAANGGFSLPDLPAGNYRLAVYRSGYVVHQEGLSVEGGFLLRRDVRLLQAALPGGVSARLRVGLRGEPVTWVDQFLDHPIFDPFATAQPSVATTWPIEGASISLPNQNLVTWTDGTGRFGFPPMASGSYPMHVERLGFESLDTHLVLVDGELAVPEYYLYYNSGSVRGHVFTTNTSSPLAGALVSIEGTSLSTLTDSLGAFEIASVTAGDVWLRAIASNHDSLLIKTGVAIGRATSLAIVLDYAYGTLYGDVRDPNGNLLEGASVSLPAQGLTTLSNAAGLYRFENVVRTGSMIPVGATFAGFGWDSGFVTISPAQATLRNFVVPAISGDLIGRVRNLATGGSIPGAVVSLVNLGLSRTSDALGEYRFLSVPEGWHAMKVSAAGFSDLTTYGEVSRLTTMNWDVFLSQQGDVTGVVRDSSSRQPLAGVAIELTDSGRTARSNTRGEFGFTALPAGNVEARFTLTGYDEKLTNLTVVVNQSTANDVDLNRSP